MSRLVIDGSGLEVGDCKERKDGVPTLQSLSTCWGGEMLLGIVRSRNLASD